MMQNDTHRLLAGLCLALFILGQAAAQMTVTGSITGSVKDPSGEMVAGASVALTSEATGEVRTVSTNESGNFTFAAVQPDAYSLKVERAGFKAVRRTGVVLSANDRLSLGEIRLEIGAVTETVNVVAEGAAVQTTSAEHSAVITPSQIANIQARGRDITSLLRLLPGVQATADSDSVGGSYGSGTPNIGGMSNNTNILAVDGVVSNDMGTPNVFSSVTTMDAIGEVKIILNSYQAEYAGNGGAIVEVITRSGGRDFHGSAYSFLRNDALNANDFFNNRNSVRRPRYRYDTLGFSLGGPIYIPHKFNKDRNRLFGFYNLENWGISTPGALNKYTMPTAQERTGDFSQTVDVGNRLIPIADPTTRNPFPGNIIPANRINPSGQALLNTLPLPNFINRTLTGGNYNYQIQEVLKDPKRSQLFRVDYVPDEKDRFSVRGKTWLAQQQGYAVAAGATPVGFFGQCYCFTESGLSAGWTHTFAPTVVMEVTTGLRHNREAWYPYPDQGQLNKVLKSAIGYKLSQWYPQSNPQGYIPRYSFGGVPSAPNVSWDDRFLTGGTDFTFTFNDNVTIIRGAHTLKLGMDAYRMREYEGERSKFDGTFAFARDTNNPLDTNWAFSNAALGIFDSYTESTARYGANERQSIVEWFVQDSWKATRKLTLELGLRFSWYNQMYPRYDGQQSVLGLDRYNLQDVPPLYRAAFGPNNVRMAQNPLTGQLLPAAYIGAFVPGIGNPAAGGVLSGDKNYPRGFVDQQPLLYGPRLGFAYDPFGKGKTAIRGGAAILYNIRVSKWSPTTNNPPAIFSPIAYYGSMDTFLQSTGVFSPSDTNAFNRQQKTPDVYNLSLGVQQDIGFNTLLDVSYLGVFGRHLAQTKALNTIPYGAHFAAANADLTSPGKPLPDNFFRPRPGYNNITFSDNAYNSSYNGLLVSANRRFARGVQFGMAYTFSKYMDYTGIPVYRPLRVWSYGKDSSDQTHILSFNYIWEVPRASKIMPGAVTRQVLDHWQLSGGTGFVSGQPSGAGYSTTDNADITGGGDGARINLTGSPIGNHTFQQWFNTAVFARPQKGDPGNAPKDVVRLPGVNNWDMALTKRFPLKSEARTIQFRAEAYNAWNHTQFSGVNTSASFNPQGQQVNALFGQVTSTRTPRVLQFSLRASF